MEDGSTGSSGRGTQPEPTDAPPDNRRQAFLILATMVAFFVGLVILASWAAGHG
jgi:hypothetical protein